MFQEAVSNNPILQVNSPEDSFIELMALGRIVMLNDKQHIEAASLEGLITNMIEVNRRLPRFTLDICTHLMLSFTLDKCIHLMLT